MNLHDIAAAHGFRILWLSITTNYTETARAWLGLPSFIEATETGSSIRIFSCTCRNMECRDNGAGFYRHVWAEDRTSPDLPRSRQCPNCRMDIHGRPNE